MAAQLVSTLLAVAISFAVGVILFRIFSPKESNATASRFAKSWCSWTLLLCSVALFPNFISKPFNLNDLAIWIASSVGYGGIAFFLGWIYGTFRLRNTGSGSLQAPQTSSQTVRIGASKRLFLILSSLWTSARWNKASLENIEEEFWNKAMEEYQSPVRRQGLYARCLAMAEGDEEKARAAYLKCCAQELKSKSLMSAVVLDQTGQGVMGEVGSRGESLLNDTSDWTSKKVGTSFSGSSFGWLFVLAGIFALAVFLYILPWKGDQGELPPQVSRADGSRNVSARPPVQVSGAYEVGTAGFLQSGQLAGIERHKLIDARAVRIDLNQDGVDDYVVGFRGGDGCGNAALLSANGRFHYAPICNFGSEGSLGRTLPQAFFSSNTSEHIVVKNNGGFEHWFYERPAGKWIVQEYSHFRDDARHTLGSFDSTGTYRTQTESP